MKKLAWYAGGAAVLFLVGMALHDRGGVTNTANGLIIVAGLLLVAVVVLAIMNSFKPFTG